MSIYIFSGPIHSGKTTHILKWCRRQESVSGILMPDIDGRRKIIDLDTMDVFDIECADTANTKEALTSVGSYNFFNAVFEKANAILIAAISRSPRWLVIDEAGKLELKGKGFYHSIMQAIEHYSNSNTHGNLIIIVRDSLYKEVVSHFKITTCKIIYSMKGIGQG